MGIHPGSQLTSSSNLPHPQAEECFHNKFLAKLSAWLRWCCELTKLNQHNESIHHKHQYDQKVRASRLEPRGFCLVRWKVFGGKHEIADHWENTNTWLLSNNQISQYTLLNYGKGKDELGWSTETYLCTSPQNGQNQV